MNLTLYPDSALPDEIKKFQIIVKEYDQNLELNLKQQYQGLFTKYLDFTKKGLELEKEIKETLDELLKNDMTLYEKLKKKFPS